MGILPQQGFDNIPSMFEDVYASTPGTSPSSATRRWTRRASSWGMTRNERREDQRRT